MHPTALIDHYVEQARAREVSWNEIGEVLGMSKQGAQQRFRGRWFDRFIRPTKGRSARRLTDRVRRSIEHAREEARALDHNYVGTEHLLLGLLREKDGVAAKALKKRGIRPNDIRRKIEDHLGRGPVRVSGDIPFTPRAKRALQEAHQQAAVLGHNYVGTEHVALALASLEEGLAARFLVELGSGASDIRDEVVGLLSGYERS